MQVHLLSKAVLKQLTCNILIFSPFLNLLLLYVKCTKRLIKRDQTSDHN